MPSYRDTDTLYREPIPYRGLVPATILQEFLPDYRIMVVDRNGFPKVELDLAYVDHVTWELNAPGEMVFKNPIIDPKVATYPRLLIDEVQLWVDDELSWWGVPWREAQDVQNVEFTCHGLLSYFTKRFITYTSLLYTSLEQLTIAANLVSHGQTGANMPLFIDIDSYTPSGHVRSRDYKREDHANILDLLNEFPTLDDGFDFEIEVDGTGNRVWTPYYPVKGYYKPNLVLEWGRNINNYSVNGDAVDLATQVYVTGGTAGDVKFEQNHEDEDASAIYGRMQAIVADGSQNDVGWLLERAEKEVDTRKEPAEIPEVTAVNVPIQLLGVVKTGDVVPLRIRNGRTQVSGDYRVVKITWKVDPNTLEFVLNKAA
jgi:hypothetical protein